MQKKLVKGYFGIEREMLRIRKDGYFAHTAHPFPEDPQIVRDFCENQVEINTGVHDHVRGVMEELKALDLRVRKGMNSGEVLWPFSNPPYIRDESDIPVAVFTGAQYGKTKYRDYLSGKYGRYKMTFSGIHFNFSFGDEKMHRDQVYLDLAQGLTEYGWILIALTAASPLQDSSFLEKGKTGETVFTGMGSCRCSENGYWNEFVPVMDYSGLTAYAEKIRTYVDRGWLRAPSELYYPIRLKPHGENDLNKLEKGSISHIELRMIDLNPLAEQGVDEKDLRFAHLLIGWLSALEPHCLRPQDQLRAVGNFKRAARYDLETVNYVDPEGRAISMQEAGKQILTEMRHFYADEGEDIQQVLDFEYEKFENPARRYPVLVREKFGDGFVREGLLFAVDRQRKVLSQKDNDV